MNDLKGENSKLFFYTWKVFDQTMSGMNEVSA